MSKRYAILDADGTVQNIVAWDGTSKWKHGANRKPVLIETPDVTIGSKFVNGAFQAPLRSIPTLVEKAHRARMAGVNVESAAFPAINGLYGCDDAALARFWRAVGLIQQGGGKTFPAKLKSLPWPLLDGTLVEFVDVQTFLAVHDAVLGYAFALDLVVATKKGPLPAASVKLP